MSESPKGEAMQEFIPSGKLAHMLSFLCVVIFGAEGVQNSVSLA
jgi:hypothetical protein